MNKSVTRYWPSIRHLIVAPALGLMVTACGGGDSPFGNPLSPSVNSPTYSAGNYPASSQYAARCTNPRPGTADKSGSAAWEKSWLRSWSNELYLWYQELPDINPNNGDSTLAYFDRLQTPAITASGAEKDKFHFTYPTDQWLALSQSGVSAGYGAEWVLLKSLPPREIRAAYVELSGPATQAGIVRNTQVLSVDGVDIVNGNINGWPEGLFPDRANETHVFVVRDPNGTQRTINMTSADITSSPVLKTSTLTVGTSKVGYLLFNSHIAPAEQQLINAFTTLKNNNVTDLVLDLRYNGGGYLAIASQVGYMIAGPNRTSNQVFERTLFNSKYPNTDPVTKQPLTPMPFIDTAIGLSAPQNTPLPTLNLGRVFVLTGSGTCSASESIINGLRGVGVQVIQIGNTTCGKPYGFYPQDNCGTTYFTIQFQGVNAQNFGDYSDGFTPANANNNIQPKLPGCAVADDLAHELGDTSEGRLAAALYYRTNNSCANLPSGLSNLAAAQLGTANNVESDGTLLRSPVREIRLVKP